MVENAKKRFILHFTILPKTILDVPSARIYSDSTKNASQTNIVRTIEDNKISPDFSIELKAIYKRVDERKTKYGELSND
jgi:hypothetical protein